MRNKTLLAGALVGVALLLGACSSSGGGTTPGGDGGPVGDGNPDHDACLLGTWHLDLQDVADQLAGLMAVPGATADTEGTVTVVFGPTADVTYANTLTLTFPVSDMPMVGKAVYSGTASVPDWTAKDGVFTGGTPSGDFDITMTFTVGGVSMPAPFELPAMGNLGGGVPLDYTCAGDTAALTPPAPAPTWHLTRA